MSKHITIHIPTPLRPYVDHQDEVQIEADGSVEMALKQLTSQYSKVQKHLFNDAGELRKFVNIYVNDEDIRYSGGNETPVKAGDVISIVPSIAGG